MQIQVVLICFPSRTFAYFQLNVQKLPSHFPLCIDEAAASRASGWWWLDPRSTNCRLSVTDLKKKDFPSRKLLLEAIYTFLVYETKNVDFTVCRQKVDGRFQRLPNQAGSARKKKKQKIFIQCGPYSKLAHILCTVQ